MNNPINLDKLNISLYNFPKSAPAAVSSPSTADESTQSFTDYDRCLELFQKCGAANEAGWIKKDKIPQTLPPLSTGSVHDLLRFYHYVHDIDKKEDPSQFCLSIPQLVSAVLLPLGIYSFKPCLVGGAVYAYIDPAYLKVAFDQLAPNLGSQIPEECFEAFNSTPSDYDFRIYLHTKLSYEDFQLLKRQLIQAFVMQLTYQNRLNQAEWVEVYTFVNDHYFQKLKIVYNETNKFLLTSFINSEFTIDIVWVDNLDVEYLFLHNSLKLYIPMVNFGMTPLITPYGDIANGFQALFDKTAKIIHANCINENNFKAWFIFLQLQASHYRSYEKDLEKKTLLIALKHLDKEKDKVKYCCDTLQQCLTDHLEGDPTAYFCYAFSACRSLQHHHQKPLAQELYAACQPRFPESGLPALFAQEDSVELHLALLQLCGALAHDGKTICRTQDNFHPALQFILPGKGKSFTLLLPLQLPAALAALLRAADNKVVERHLAHFEPLFLTTPFQSALPEKMIAQGLNHPEPAVQRLFYYLALCSKHEKVLHYYPTNPGAFLAAATEKYIQSFDETFTLDPQNLVKSLFKLKHPRLLLTAYELWGKDKEIRLIGEISHPYYQIKMLKHVDPSSLLPVLTPQLMPCFKSHEGIALFQDFMAILEKVENPPLSEELVELYLAKFGYQPQIAEILKKCKGAGSLLLNADSKDVLKIWQENPALFTPKEEALFLTTQILQATDEEACNLLPSLNRDLLDKKSARQVADKIEKLKAHPHLGTGVMLKEIDYLIAKREFTPAAALLHALLSREPGEKEEVKKRLLALPKIPENLWLHPKISLYLSAEEILAGSAPISKAMEVFPSPSESVNRIFISQLLKKRNVHSAKVTAYVIQLQDKELIMQWLEAAVSPLSPAEIGTLLNLKLPQVSPFLRKATTRETLETMKDAYAAYIPLTTEISAWITLILEAKLFDSYPVLEWMENTPPTLAQLSLCPPLRVKEFIRKFPVVPDNLSALLPLYETLFTPADTAPFLTAALQHTSNSLKQNVWQLCRPHITLETRPMAIRLLIQMKDETLFKLEPWNEEIAKGAAQLIKEPQKEIQRLYRLLPYGKNDPSILTLCAQSKHLPLLGEVAASLTYRVHAFPDKIKDHLLNLEAILKNCHHATPLLDIQLKALLSIFNSFPLNNTQLVMMVKALMLYPKPFTLLAAFEAAYCYLSHNGDKEEETLAKLFELGIQDATLHIDTYLCLCHYNLPKLMNKAKIEKFTVQVIEEMLIDAAKTKDPKKIRQIIEIFFVNYRTIYRRPLREKNCITLLMDAMLAMPGENVQLTMAGPFVHLLYQINLPTGRMTQQSAGYFKSMNLYDSSADPLTLPHEPHDHHFDYSMILLKKMLSLDPKEMDNNHELYEFICVHLSLLALIYPENIAELIPYITQYVMYQLPSAHDLALDSLQAKCKLVLHIIESCILRKDTCQEMLEACYLTATELKKVYNIPIQQSQIALKTVIFRLIHHPSLEGVAYACSLLTWHIEIVKTLDDNSLNFLIKEIMEAIVKKPFYQVNGTNIMHYFLPLLFDLMPDKTPLGLSRLQDYFSMLCKIIVESNDTQMATQALRLLELCLQQPVFQLNHGIFLTFLNNYVNAVLKLGKRTRSFKGHLIHAVKLGLRAYDKKGFGQLIATILLTLKATPAKDFGSFLNIVGILHLLKSDRELFHEVAIRVRADRSSL